MKELLENLNLSSARMDFLQWKFEGALASGALPPIHAPLVHRFTPGLYTRQITMPAGVVIFSQVHKTEHPFVISKGRVSVWSEKDGVVELSAPHSGITLPGTRRLLIVHEETIWTTFHPTGPAGLGNGVLSEADLPALQKALTEIPDVSYIGEQFSVTPAPRELEAAV